jgi:hypothetical protein
MLQSCVDEYEDCVLNQKEGSFDQKAESRSCEVSLESFLSDTESPIRLLFEMYQRT